MAYQRRGPERETGGQQARRVCMKNEEKGLVGGGVGGWVGKSGF